VSAPSTSGNDASHREPANRTPQPKNGTTRSVTSLAHPLNRRGQARRSPLRSSAGRSVSPHTCASRGLSPSSARAPASSRAARLRVVGDRFALRPPSGVYPPAQFGKFRFRKAHLELADGGVLTACLLGAFGHGCPLVLSSCRQDAGRAGHDADVPIASRVALAACDPHP
jgi:hypothetical protein